MASRAKRSVRTFGERYSCSSCGRCCKRWKITVTADRVAQLKQHDWATLGIKDPFIPAGDQEYRLRMVDGHCVFLDDNQMCRIHQELRYEDKPESCKAFPLHLAKVGETTYARLSFYCPSVCADEGKSLEEQGRWIQATRKGAGDITRSAPLKLNEGLELTLADVERIERVLLSFLQSDAPWADRISAGAGMLRTLCARTEKKGKKAIDKVLENAQKSGLETQAAIGREEGSAMGAGTVLSLFLGQDTLTQTKLSRVGQFFNVRLANLGLAALNSGAMGARARWGKFRRVRFAPSEQSNALLTRFLVSKIQAKRYLAGDSSVLVGYNLVVVGYTILNLLSRLRAASQKREATDDQDILMAVQATDLLVFEHSNIVHNKMFAQFMESMLSETDLCASMMAKLRS